MSLITMRDLATTGMGRFANQCFQVPFLNIYADAHGCELQHAPWVGEHLFGYPRKPVTNESLPVYEEQRTEDGYPVMPDGDSLVNHDFRGWAQHHASFYRPYRARIISMLSPLPDIVAPLADPLRRLRNQGQTLVGVHLRRGDYGQNEFYITPVSWYLRALDQIWPTLTNPVLFVASEDPSLAPQFAAYGPVTADRLGVTLKRALPHATYLDYDLQKREPWQMDFFPDFHLLSQCNVLLIPNSTFSFMAAMLAPNLQQCYRSHLPTQTFVPVDPWDSWPLTHDRVQDYPDVEGIAVNSNPRW